MLFDTAAFTEGLSLLMSWSVLLYIILGLIVGILLGALPGVSGVLGIAIMLPLTYHMAPINAIMFLTAIFTGSVYAGGITAIILNIPGTASAVATTFDGYPLTKMGRQNEALGISLGSSVIGCLFGYIIILFFIQPLGSLVLSFGAPEMLMLTVLALTIIGTVRDSMIRSFISGTLGLLLGTIGATAFGRPRGTFGNIALYDGIELVSALMGLLAVSELFFLVSRKFIVDKDATAQKNFRDILRGIICPLKDKINTLRSSFIGLFIGLLPAAGSTVASLVSYGQAQLYSKYKRNFGNGEPSGVVAAETANNASEGGSMATMMTFGIPGGSATAILLAAFMIHGLMPGPYFIRDHMDMAYAVIVGNMTQAIFLLFIGLVFIWFFSKVVFIPTRILIPIIAILATVGAFSVRGLYIDPLMTLIFAILGFILRKLDYPVIALLLGLILGSLIDGELSRTIVMYDGRYTDLLSRPVFVVMFVLTIIMFFLPLVLKLFRKESKESTEEMLTK